jgi:hypothetical protein
MKVNIVQQIRRGRRIAYNDGRPGHQGVEATVLSIGQNGMTVQFDDRADRSYILFSEPRWMDFIVVVK